MASDIGLLELTGEDFHKDIRTVLGLPPQALISLAETANTDEGLDTSEETLKKVVRTGVLSGEDAACALRIAGFLRKQADEQDVSTESVLSELASYCKKKGIEGYEAALEALRELLEPKATYKEAKNRQLYEYGVLYSLKSISAVADLRAVLDDDAEIKELVPILLVRMILEDDRDEATTFAFQVNEKQLTKLAEAVHKYEDNLARVKAARGSLSLETDRKV